MDYLKRIADEWHERAGELAEWVMSRLVNRTDVWGWYVRRKGEEIAPASPHVQGVIDSDSVEPSAELAFALEGAEPSDNLDQHLLRYLFSVLRLKVTRAQPRQSLYCASLWHGPRPRDNIGESTSRAQRRPNGDE
jgi:hypothetical protein